MQLPFSTAIVATSIPPLWRMSAPVSAPALSSPDSSAFVKEILGAYGAMVYSLTVSNLFKHAFSNKRLMA